MHHPEQCLKKRQQKRSWGFDGRGVGALDGRGCGRGKINTGILTDEENSNVNEVDINFHTMPNEDETAPAIEMN